MTSGFPPVIAGRPKAVALPKVVRSGPQPEPSGSYQDGLPVPVAGTKRFTVLSKRKRVGAAETAGTPANNSRAASGRKRKGEIIREKLLHSLEAYLSHNLSHVALKNPQPG